MSKVRVALGIILPLIVVAAAVFVLNAMEEIELSEQDIQSAIDKALPYTTDGGTVVERAQVQISESIEVTLVVTGETLGKPYRTMVIADGLIEYRSKRGEFYFVPDQIDIETFTWGEQTIRERTGAWLGSVAESTLGGQLLDLASKGGVSVEGMGSAAEHAVKGVVSTAAAHALGAVPVYTLSSDLTGNATRLMLSSVEVTNGQVIAHLSVWGFTGSMILMMILGAFLIFLGLEAPFVLDLLSLLFELLSGFWV